MSSVLRSLDASAWGRVLLTWLALAVVMSINGVFRELALRPTLGPRIAPVVSAALGIALVLLVTRALLPPLRGHDTRTLLQVCAVILLLTVAFETALGLFVDHKSWRALLGHYAFWRGELWPVVLVVLALTPFIWGRRWPAE
jgi:hypothetical protein